MRQYSTYMPTVCAFVASLLLSLIALHFNPILPRDSAFYVDIASVFATEGFASLTARFDWPWLSLIIALIHKATGLTLIGSGHLLMALLMAGTCALLTRSTQLLNPAAAWWGSIVSLSIPAFNQYRDAILREPGFWLFTALSLLAVGLWATRPNQKWRYFIIATVSIMAAMLFRLEAAFLFGALGFTALFTYSNPFSRRKALWLLAIGFSLTAISLIVYLLAQDALQSNRVNYYLQLLNLSNLATQLSANSTVLTDHLLKKYSHDDAELILLSGYFGIIILTSIKLLGPYAITVAISGRDIIQRPLNLMTIYSLSALALYLTILITFFIQQNFMIDRYLATIHILSTPLIALSAWQFQQRFPLAGRIAIVIAAVLALSNVVSLSDKRTHYIPAGEWIESNLPVNSHIYYSDGRMSFYAGRQYKLPSIEEDQALGAKFENYDYFILESTPATPLLKEHLETGRLEILAEFSNGKRRKLVILGKKSSIDR